MHPLAATVVPANATVLDYIYPTLSAATVLLLGYIARKVTIAVRKFRSEHEWLIETTTKHSEQISENTTAIRRMLEQREKLIEQIDRQGGRRR